MGEGYAEWGGGEVRLVVCTDTGADYNLKFVYAVWSTFQCNSLMELQTSNYIILLKCGWWQALIRIFLQS